MPPVPPSVLLILSEAEMKCSLSSLLRQNLDPITPLIFKKKKKQSGNQTELDRRTHVDELTHVGNMHG